MDGADFASTNSQLAGVLGGFLITAIALLFDAPAVMVSTRWRCSPRPFSS